jgi:hypothetical protein
MRQENAVDEAGGEENEVSWSDLVGQEMLTERVTLDQYLARRMSHLRAHPDYERLLAEQRQPLEALAMDSDEWWEWISGTEPLMQQGGLALVRSSKVVWARMDWLS